MTTNHPPQAADDAALRKAVMRYDASRPTGIDSIAGQELIRDIQTHYATRIAEAERKGMERAKQRVLRRTEIPADARNPTRDATVILGEQIADIIQKDIDVLTPPVRKKT